MTPATSQRGHSDTRLGTPSIPGNHRCPIHRMSHFPRTKETASTRPKPDPNYKKSRRVQSPTLLRRTLTFMGATSTGWRPLGASWGPVLRDDTPPGVLLLRGRLVMARSAAAACHRLPRFTSDRPADETTCKQRSLPQHVKGLTTWESWGVLPQLVTSLADYMG